MSDRPLNFFLNLGGHVEPPKKAFISPLPGYVESKPCASGDRPAKPLVPKQWLSCLIPMMSRGFFYGPQHHLVAHDGVFTANRRCGFNWKKRP